MRQHKLLIGLLIVGTTLATALAAANPPPVASYVGPGTVVTSFDLLQRQLTVVDNGAVVCRDGNDDGRYESGNGGACIRFDELGGDGVLVQDDQYGTDVAFQVCLDMNGDGACTGGGGEGGANDSLADVLDDDARCNDAIIFSHSSFDGSFANPLDVSWMRGYWDWCQADAEGGFPGYVVILCAGFHKNVGGAPHTHEVTTGTIHGVRGGSHGGDYCGGPVAAKEYVLE